MSSSVQGRHFRNMHAMAPNEGDDKKKICKLGLDRMSKLPDDILVHVLSFVDIKGAARSSLLSRRWRNVWTKLVDLSISFDYSPEEDSRILSARNNKYLEWINHIISRHDALLIDSFKVDFPFNVHHSTHVAKWIEFALQKGVRKLELNFSYLNTPPNNRCHICWSFDYMPFADQLESLTLVGVDIDGIQLQTILYYCHNLESLSLKHNRSISTLQIVSSSSSSCLKLKRLELFCCLYLKKLYIYANNLTSLLLHGGEDFYVDYLYVPSLVEAHFNGTYCGHLIANFHHLSGFSSRLEKLSLLFLNKPIPAPTGFSSLTSLKTLNLGIVSQDGDSLLFLISYLEACPLLHHFSLKIHWTKRQIWTGSRLNRKEATSIYRAEQKQKHRKLKVVEIVGFNGSIPEVQLVLHLVNNFAMKLDKIIFDARNPSWVGVIDLEYPETLLRGPRNRAAQLVRRLPSKLTIVIV